jgi:hypothetical protein
MISLSWLEFLALYQLLIALSFVERVKSLGTACLDQNSWCPLENGQNEGINLREDATKGHKHNLFRLFRMRRRVKYECRVVGEIS